MAGPDTVKVNVYLGFKTTKEHGVLFNELRNKTIMDTTSAWLPMLARGITVLLLMT